MFCFIENNLEEILKSINLKTGLISQIPTWSLNDPKITVQHNSIITLQASLFNENQAHSQKKLT